MLSSVSSEEEEDNDVNTFSINMFWIKTLVAFVKAEYIATNFSLCCGKEYSIGKDTSLGKYVMLKQTESNMNPSSYTLYSGNFLSGFII